MATEKACLKCKGTRRASWDSNRPCISCDGRGVFPAVDVEAILELIVTTRGTPKFRASWPGKGQHDYTRAGNVLGARAYSVWRWACFHGGKNVCLPMMAGIFSQGDPYQDELQALSEEVAKRVFGTDRAGAARWCRLLTNVRDEDVPDGLPATAYSGGPVVQGELSEDDLPEVLSERELVEHVLDTYPEDSEAYKFAAQMVGVED